MPHYLSYVRIPLAHCRTEGGETRRLETRARERDRSGGTGEREKSRSDTPRFRGDLEILLEARNLSACSCLRDRVATRKIALPRFGDNPMRTRPAVRSGNRDTRASRSYGSIHSLTVSCRGGIFIFLSLSLLHLTL